MRRRNGRNPLVLREERHQPLGEEAAAARRDPQDDPCVVRASLDEPPGQPAGHSRHRRTRHADPPRVRPRHPVTHRQRGNRLDTLRDADLAAHPDRHPGDDSCPATRRKAWWRMHLAQKDDLAVVRMKRQVVHRFPFREWPLDGADPEPGRHPPFHSGGQPRFPRVRPVDVPSWGHDEPQSHPERRSSAHRACFGDQCCTDPGGPTGGLRARNDGPEEAGNEQGSHHDRYRDRRSSRTDSRSQSAAPRWRTTMLPARSTTYVVGSARRPNASGRGVPSRKTGRSYR